MTEHTINHQQTTHTHGSASHACQHKAAEEGLWNKNKEAAHNATEKSGSMWEATKDVTSDVWEKTKEVGSDAWNATKNFAGHVGDALTGQDDEDEIETYYMEDESETSYLDDEENAHLNRENKRINNEHISAKHENFETHRH